jgi:hypothetical protein
MVPDHVAQNCTTSHQRPSCGNLDHVRCRGSHVLRLYNRAPELRHDKVNMRPRAAVGCRRKQNAHLSPSPRIMPPFATDFTGFLKALVVGSSPTQPTVPLQWRGFTFCEDRMAVTMSAQRSTWRDGLPSIATEASIQRKDWARTWKRSLFWN